MNGSMGILADKWKEETDRQTNRETDRWVNWQTNGRMMEGRDRGIS
jgi:hypothetical protein